MRKYAVGAVALLALMLTFLGGPAAGSPGTAGASGSVASYVTSPASGQCSKAEAIDAVKRLGLRDISPNYPVYKVLCGAFTGAGSKTMVVSLGGDGASTGMLYWAVFRWTGTEWQFLMKQRQAAVLTAAGSDIRETVSIFREGDARCCPSGGTKARIWHWNGTRFTAGAWTLETPGTAATSAEFFSPSRDVACNIGDSSGLPARQVFCRSETRDLTVELRRDGRLYICRDGCLGHPSQSALSLAYGKQITVGRFRCIALRSGMKCTLIPSGKGFLINRDRVRRVG